MCIVIFPLAIQIPLNVHRWGKLKWPSDVGSADPVQRKRVFWTRLLVELVFQYRSFTPLDRFGHSQLFRLTVEK